MEFKKLGLSEDQIKNAESFGIRYKKYQKNNLLKTFNTSPPDEEYLRNFQDSTTPLPIDYIEFIKKHNGGIPSKQKIHGENRVFVVDGLLMFSHGEDVYDSVENHLKVYSSRIPKDTIPIGRTPSGDIIIMNVSPSDFGSIFCWLHELEAETDGSSYYGNCIKLANSFSEFIDKLFD